MNSRCTWLALALVAGALSASLRSAAQETPPVEAETKPPEAAEAAPAEAAPTGDTRAESPADPSDGEKPAAEGAVGTADGGTPSPNSPQSTESPAEPKSDAPSEKPEPPSSFKDALRSAREGRCRTAICWGSDYKWAIEPLAELPVGKTFSLSHKSDLGNYINNHNYSASLAAGIRVWLFHDLVSVAMYISTPLGGDDTVRVRGSSYEFPATKIKRPYPGFALGLLADTLWIGFDHEQLRNGDSDAGRDPSFPRNAVVDRVWTLTVSIATITAIRNGLGIATSDNEDSAPAKDAPESTQ